MTDYTITRNKALANAAKLLIQSGAGYSTGEIDPGPMLLLTYAASAWATLGAALQPGEAVSFTAEEPPRRFDPDRNGDQHP